VRFGGRGTLPRAPSSGGSAKSASMTPEQLRAFRHATASEGLALIDGQTTERVSVTVLRRCCSQGY
jgi:hypothetical protein